MKRNLLFFSMLIFVPFLLFTQCKKEKTTDYEDDLSEVINQYRADNGLKEIPISPSLTHVAELHVKDLAENQPAQGECNLHSWSDNGDWNACCYTPDHAQASCMWDKPRELTNYTGNGYEISAWYSGEMNTEQALSQWQNSEGHNNVILSRDIWSDAEWNAIGAAIYDGYAVVWFGKEVDLESEK